MQENITNTLTLIIFLVAFVACAAGGLWFTREQKIVAGSAEDHGTKGEQKVHDILTRAGYGVITDIILIHGGSTHQIDHIVRGADCLWVLETKTWRGTVVGRQGGRVWTLHRPDNRPSISTYNPLLQNQRHADIIEKICRVPVIPIVVSVGALNFSPALTGLVLPLSALTARLGAPAPHTERIGRVFKDLMLLKTSRYQKELANKHRRGMENGRGGDPVLVLILASLISLAVAIYEMYIILSTSHTS